MNGPIKDLKAPPALNCPVDGGKYRIVMEQDGALRIDRCGEPWMGGATGIAGAKVFISLANEAIDARSLLAEILREDFDPEKMTGALIGNDIADRIRKYLEHYEDGR